MGQIWGFLRSVSVNIGSASQNVQKLILKSPIFVAFGANFTQFGTNLTPLIHGLYFASISTQKPRQRPPAIQLIPTAVVPWSNRRLIVPDGDRMLKTKGMRISLFPTSLHTVKSASSDRRKTGGLSKYWLVVFFYQDNH